MKAVTIMRTIKTLGPDHREGVVTVSVRDLAEWMADLEEAIALLRASSQHQGVEWRVRRGVLLGKFEEAVLH